MKPCLWIFVVHYHVTRLIGEEKVKEIEEGKEGKARPREGEPQGQTPRGLDPQQARKGSQGISQGFRGVCRRGGSGGAREGGVA